MPDNTTHQLMLAHLGLTRKPTPAEAVELFMIPPRTPMARLEQQVADSAAKFDFEHDGDRIQGWKWGDGPPVFLVHGWAGRGMQLSAYAEPIVAAGWSAVTWDHPGHGESEGSYCTAIRVAECMQSLEGRFGPPIGIVAHSFGAICATYALHLGLDCPAVAYLAPSADIPQRFISFGRLLGLEGAELEEYWRLAKERFAPVDLDQVSPYQLAPKLGRIRAMFLHDPGDAELDFSNAARIHEAWSGSILIETPGMGHRRIIRDRKVAGQVVDFLEAK